MKILIPRAHLAAAYLFAAEQDIRYYLNGVHVEADARETRIVATNGSFLAVLKSQPSAFEPVSLTVPSFTVKTVLDLHKKEEFLLLDVTPGAESLGPFEGVQQRFKPTEKYPEYRKVFPASLSGEAGEYDVELLAVFAKAARVLGLTQPRTVCVAQNGPTSSAIVHILNRPEFVGLVMPVLPTAERAAVPVPMWGRE